MPSASYPPEPGSAEPEQAFVFDDSVGNDLRAIRSRRRRLFLELFVTLVGALVIGAVCGLLLTHW